MRIPASAATLPSPPPGPPQRSRCARSSASSRSPWCRHRACRPSCNLDERSGRHQVRQAPGDPHRKALRREHHQCRGPQPRVHSRHIVSLRVRAPFRGATVSAPKSRSAAPRVGPPSARKAPSIPGITPPEAGRSPVATGSLRASKRYKQRPVGAAGVHFQHPARAAGKGRGGHRRRRPPREGRAPRVDRVGARRDSQEFAHRQGRVVRCALN
jgi:hypothetical protein